MDNRQLTAAVCGIVAGVIVAGGVLSAGSDMRLAGSLTEVAYRAGTVDIDTSAARRRAIDDSGRVATPEYVPVYPTVKDESGSSSAPAASDDATCLVAREIVSDLQAAHNTAVPDRIANRKARKIFQDAVDAVLFAHCGEKPAVKKPRAARVDNDCEKYPEATARRVECESNEKLGKAYPEEL